MKNKGQISGRAIFVLVLAVALAAIITIAMLRQQADEAQQAVMLLSRLEVLSNKLSALEWSFERKADPEVLEKVQDVESQLAQTLDELMKLDPGDERLQQLDKAQLEFESSMDEMFRLIAAGDFEKAEALNRGKVDPSFDLMSGIIANASAAYSERAQQAQRASDAGTAFVVVAAGAMIGFLSLRFQNVKLRAGLIAAEQKALRKAHDELEIRVQERTAELEKINNALEAEISEHKRAEESLKLFSEAVEEASNGIQITDLSGHIIYSNRAVEEIYGFSAAEYKGKHVNEMNMDPEFASTVILPTIKETGRWAGELMVRHKDGHAFPIWLTTSMIRNSRGEPIAIVGIITDITEQKQTEEALRESEEKFRSIIEQSGDGIVLTDEQGTVIEWNRGEEQIIGLKRAEVIGRPLWDLHFQVTFEERKTPENYERIKAKMLELIRTGRSDSFNQYWEADIQRPDGTRRAVQILVFLIKTNKGFKASSISRDITERKRIEKKLRTAHDELEKRVRERTAELTEANEALRSEVTERRKAEEAIREQERFLSNVFSSIQDGLSILDDELNIKRVNPTIEQWYEHTMPLSGKKCYQAYNGRNEPCEFCPGRRTLNTGEADYEVVPKRGAGGEMTGWLEVYTFPLIDRATGQIKGVIEYVHDITGRKLVEESLKQSEEKYHTLVDNIQDGVFIVQDTKIQFVNEAFARMAGYTVGEVIGEDFRQLVAPEDLEMVTDRYYRRLAGEDVPKDYELRMLHKDGRTRILTNMIIGLINYRGRLASMGTVKDITEKKKLEAQLLRAQRMESIGTLAGGIAHDLNNVLTPMMLSLQILKEKFKDEQSQKLLNILETNTHRGANLIKQVMSFVRGIEGERTALQVAHIIAEIEKIAKETFPRSIEIRTDIQRDLPTISGDATQLHQVLMNLCVNARDAMPHGGILGISAEYTFVDASYARMNLDSSVGPFVTITVTDTGTGIPPEILSRIFEPFFTTKEFGKGTGLGLSTALGIVKGHGGFIDVYSEVGKGAAFKVYLPAAKAETQKAQEQQHEMPSGHGELVFIVDDETEILEITRASLEKYGYRVLTANDGAEAIRLYSQNMKEIKIILMDMMMPVKDGPASIQALRNIDPMVKIIGVSGLTEKDKIMDDTGIQVHAFLTKPYTTRSLLRTIYEVMSMR